MDQKESCLELILVLGLQTGLVQDFLNKRSHLILSVLK